MTPDKQNPAGQSRASRDSLDGPSQSLHRPFADHRKAALALLTNRPDLSHKEAGFLGNVCVAKSLTDKQADWLVKILARHVMLHVGGGGAS